MYREQRYGGTPESRGEYGYWSDESDDINGGIWAFVVGALCGSVVGCIVGLLLYLFP